MLGYAYAVVALICGIVIYLVFRGNRRRYHEPELIDELEGHDFEDYCASLLERNFYAFDDYTGCER